MWILLMWVLKALLVFFDFHYAPSIVRMKLVCFEDSSFYTDTAAMSMIKNSDLHKQALNLIKILLSKKEQKVII